MQQIASMNSRIIKFSGGVMAVCGVLLLLLIAARYVLLYMQMWNAQSLVWTAVRWVLGIGGFFGLMRLSLSIWGESQMRLGEMLLTLYLTAFISTGLIEWMKSIGRGQRDDEIVFPAVTMGVFLVMIAGSAWAWSVFRRSPEHAEKYRMRTFLFGWCLSYGTVGGAMLLLLAMGAASRGRLYGDLLPRMILAACGLPLLLPGIITEWKLRRSMKTRIELPQRS